MRRRIAILATGILAALAFATPAHAAEPCTSPQKYECYGVESLEASLSTVKAGAHPDLTATFTIKTDPTTKTNSFGLHDAYAVTRNVRIELPPGLLADPNVLGNANQCRAVELAASVDTKGGGCPNGSQIGIAEVWGYGLNKIVKEPIYMMQPPGGEVVARVGIFAEVIPIYVDATVRTDSDYGVNLEVVDSAKVVSLIQAKATTWGVPMAAAHDFERCTPEEVFLHDCTKSSQRDPGGRELPFLTNPTRCGVPLTMRVGASSWVEPTRYDFQSASFPEVEECDRLSFGPGLSIEPTNHRAAAPTGLDITATLPAAEGVSVLEPSQTRDVRVSLPEGMSINTAAADGLGVCSEAQVHYGKAVAAECPEDAKVADFEAEIPALPRRLKGAIYLREPEPGNLFRIWLVADDLGAHVKLPAQMNVDPQTGQIETVVLEAPQAPLREMKIVLKSGLRAPLVNPESCGSFASHYEFTPWSGGLAKEGDSAMSISEGCDTGGFSPKLSAGSTDPSAGRHSPFVFTLTREDGEQNPAALDVTLPKGLSASLAGIPRCEGADAASGSCPAASRIGKVIAAAGAGPNPLWVPQPGKRPTAVYLAGPYKGAPLSVIAVVPAQAGPFDLGDEVVRSAIYLDPDTAQGTVRSDPLPQIIEGVPIRYRTVQVELDRPGFTLNPTGCTRRAIEATLTSAKGKTAHASSPFTAVNCATLDFKPKISLRLRGGIHRGAHPSLSATLTMPPGGANIAATSVALPHSEFLDQAHIKTVCTRVQFKEGGGNGERCPPGSIYGHVKATTPILEEPLEGNVYLRSSSHPLPDMVMALKGPPSLPVAVNAVGRVDSVNGGIRTTFEGVPDAPVSSLSVTFPGGKKGLIVNSTNLCQGTHKVTAKFTAQNAKKVTLHPALQSKCKAKQGSRPKGGGR